MQQLSQIQQIPDNAINQCWVVDNAITKQKCDWILSLAEDKWETGKVGGPVKDATKTEEWLIKEEVRKSEVVFTDDNDLYDLVWYFANTANEQALWKFQLDSCQSMQITRYGVGGYYDFHIDGNGFTREITNPRSATNFKTRKLSMSIVLNDDFEGGEFEFMGSENDLIKARTGTIIIFPSYLQHRVRPVTKGVRHSLVVWFCGEPFI